jgi:hypothetical protein
MARVPRRPDGGAEIRVSQLPILDFRLRIETAWSVLCLTLDFGPGTADP